MVSDIELVEQLLLNYVVCNVPKLCGAGGVAKCVLSGIIKENDFIDFPA